MSATDQMRAMLDQLMGTTRNGENNVIYAFSFKKSQQCLSNFNEAVMAKQRSELINGPTEHFFVVSKQVPVSVCCNNFCYSFSALRSQLCLDSELDPTEDF